MRTRTGIAVVTVVAGLSLHAETAAARTATVRLANITLSKQSVAIDKGDAVVWRDLDKYVTHTVTSRGRARFLSSGSLRDGDTHSVRFGHRGSYRYVCSVHPASMRGKIVVS